MSPSNSVGYRYVGNSQFPTTGLSSVGQAALWAATAIRSPNSAIPAPHLQTENISGSTPIQPRLSCTADAPDQKCELHTPPAAQSALRNGRAVPPNGR